MRFYAEYQDGVLTGIGTGGAPGETITESEYNTLMVEIRAKAAWVDKVYADPIAIDACPAEWRDEILRRVQEWRDWAAQEAALAAEADKKQEVSPDA